MSACNNHVRSQSKMTIALMLRLKTFDGPSCFGPSFKLPTTASPIYTYIPISSKYLSANKKLI